MSFKITILVMVTLLLAACGSTPQRKGGAASTGGGYLSGDGPGADAPANIEAIPDAVPRNEPLHRYANRPYVALGKTYTPLTAVGDYKEQGIASWYGKKFHGQRTSSGEAYDMYAMSAAHPTLPIPSYARVTNSANHKSVIVRINDRGPFLHDRVIDLSYTAAYKLGIVGNGSGDVEVESLSADRTINIIPANTVQSQALAAGAPVGVAAQALAAPVSPASTVSSEALDGGVYLQLGAFESQQNAETFLEKMRAELGFINKQLKLTNKGGLVRVHIGPYSNQSEARSNAENLERTLGFKPMLNLP